MGRATSKGNEAKSKMKHPSGRPTRSGREYVETANNKYSFQNIARAIPQGTLITATNNDFKIADTRR